MLSSYYQDIQFFRYDPFSKLVYIIAKARDEGEIEVFIPPVGSRGLKKMKFDTMTKAELRAYVLAHRDDEEAFHALLTRRTPDETATWYPAPLDEKGVEVMEEAFRKKFDRKS